MVYVDGLPVDAIQSPTTRLYADSQFNQFNDLVVGRANDVEPTAGERGTAVWNVVHVDRVYSSVEIVNLIGKSG